MLDDPVSLNLTRYQHERMGNVFAGGRGKPVVAFGSDAASVAVEYAVVPPLMEASASVPFVPLVWSQAWNVIAFETVPALLDW